MSAPPLRQKITRVTIGPHVLYHGDCLKIIPRLKLDGVVHTLCDPPYESHMHRAKKGTTKKIRTDGSAELKALDFAAIEPIRRRATRQIVKASNGWFLAFCTPEGVAPWRDAIEATGARYKRACTWVKLNPAPQFNGQGPGMGAEMIVSAWCGKSYSKWNGGGRAGVWSFHCNPPDRTGLHPAEKPLALMSELVALFTNRGDTVLDPFAGVGTTGVACARYGRRFIGIEQDRRYFDAMVARLSEAVAEPDMLTEIAEIEPIQTSLLEAAK